MDSSDQYVAGDPLLRTAAGGLFSTLLRIAVDLDLFAKIKDRRVPVGELGAVWAMPASSARVLAQCLTNLGVLEYADGLVANSSQANAFLAQDCWTRWRVQHFCKGAGFPLDPDALKQLLLNPPAHMFYRLEDGEPLAAREETWWQGGQKNRIRWGEQLARRYDFSGHRLLLDVGGATGGWCIGIRRLYPHLRCIIFELPAAVPMARQAIAEEGEARSIEVVGGSFYHDPLPAGADVVLLANVLHDWTQDRGRQLLTRVLGSMATGGAVLVKEYFLEDDWHGATESLVQSLWVIGPNGKSGWQPTYGEMESLLAEVGFCDVQRDDYLVQGRKP